ncbi:DUF2180 family protein [Streptomyces exfoliatus]|uniref:DUF2180 family protein n=1 Tax=Streptomyces exfoliatus TaxID=1905 RepID=UPI00046422A4|nr:DUF2180 family protein [Streptomyces exfoliatus]
MNCYDCAQKGKTVPATAVCRHCGAAVCAEHAHVVTAEQITHNAGLGVSTLALPARRITCITCYGAEHSGSPAASPGPHHHLPHLGGRQ